MLSQSKPTRLAFVLALALALSISQSLRADLIRLNSGGELRGLIPSGKGATSGKEVTIVTLSGTVVTVAQEEIQFITKRPLKIEEYETRALRTPDTIEDQWALAEWCREQNLKSQRDEHLERIIELDPDHEKAHYGLKHTQVNGEWMSKEERMTSQGYVFHKGRWITPQELELAEKTEAEREREERWFQQVYLWKNWLTGTHAPRVRDAVKAFRELKDPDAVPALVKNFQDEDSKQLRAMYIQVLGNIPGKKPVAALVKQSLHDVDYELRYAALNEIKPDQFDAAVPLYIRELRHDLNAIVCRAGKALERMADDRVVPQLIEALITTHRYRVPVPDSGGMSFRADGTGMTNGSGTVLPPDVELALRSGQLNGVIINQQTNQLQRQPKMVTVNLDEQNREVLTTLQKITGQNFGYNERTWNLWHAAQKNGAGNLPALP